MNEMKHLGVIMDGNRRWAENHNLQSFQGHDKGADTFVDLCDWCGHAGIDYLTVYAFSTENWKRSQEEVLHIFGLLERFFNEKLARCLENDIKIKVIGERGKFSKKTLKVIADAENRTSQCKKLHVQIALSYGGRDCPRNKKACRGCGSRQAGDCRNNRGCFCVLSGYSGDSGCGYGNPYRRYG